MTLTCSRNMKARMATASSARNMMSMSIKNCGKVIKKDFAFVLLAAKICENKLYDINRK